MWAMQSPGERQRYVQNLIISLAAHLLCFTLLIALPMCSLRRFRKPEHKIYTFDLIDPSLISMKKTTAAMKPKPAPVVKREEPKKVTAKKEPEKKKEEVKKAKEEPKKKEKAKKRDKQKMGLKESKEPKEKKKSIEDRIKEQLEKIDQRKWVEADKADELEKMEKSDLMATGDFTNVSYSDAVYSRVYESWQTPSKALAQQEGLTVAVRFQIMKDGRVIQLKIEKSSGNELLDNSALQAIRDAAPLPPLPDDYTGDSLEVCMIFIPEA